MRISTEEFGEIENQTVTRIHLENKRGTRASFLTLGATWQSFQVMNQMGSAQELLLALESPSDYLASTLCAGQIVGRVAGRIKKGEVDLDGQTYLLPTNQNGHTLHGGPQGFHKQIWDFEIEERETSAKVAFFYQAKETVDGFPGDYKVTVTYELDDADNLTISIEASDASQISLFNPTNHVYFNLGDSQDLATHSLFIRAKERLEVDDELIPTGNILPLAGTPYDFQEEKAVLPAIQATGGLDDTFLVGEDEETPIAVLKETSSGNVIEMYSDRPALVIYSLNFPEEGLVFTKDNGQVSRKHQGLALEAQFAPDAIHHPEWGDICLIPAQTKQYKIRFTYRKEYTPPLQFMV